MKGLDVRKTSSEIGENCEMAGFPPGHQLKLFRLTHSTERAEYAYIVTNYKIKHVPFSEFLRRELRSLSLRMELA
jgi:hypothetical protein